MAGGAAEEENSSALQNFSMKPKKGTNANGLTPQYYTCIHADVRDIEIFDLDFSHFQPNIFNPRALSKNIGS